MSDSDEEAPPPRAVIKEFKWDGVVVHIPGSESYPLELKQMFLLKECKLCGLLLSSAVVKKDHYDGKKHSKAVKKWLMENKIASSGENVRDKEPEASLSQSRKRPAQAASNSVACQDNPVSKKGKKESQGGPNFAYCEICKIQLTSQSHADQHNEGKLHKKKLVDFRKAGNFEDCMSNGYGIGLDFKMNREWN